MINPPSDTASYLADRLDKLERQNRNLKLLAWLALLVALAMGLGLGASLYRRGLLVSQEWSSFKAVDAERIVVRDKDGKLRIMLVNDETKGPILQFKDGADTIVREISPSNP
jgi:hypothetical protein